MGFSPHSKWLNRTIIEDLVSRIEYDAPPNEIGIWPNNKPSSFEDILNAAWVFKAKRQKQLSWESASDFEKLYRLVLKGIEASFVHTVFGSQLRDSEKQ
jgi:hypothetical protein